MVFISLLMIAAAALASAAGFFSIYGLSQIFAASAISIIIMGSCLEFAKLITASLLYRMWNKLGVALKTYLMLATAVLMLITSFGVFGYLTAAYQQDNIPVTQISQTLASDKTELQRNVARKIQINQQIAKLPNNYVKSRKELMDSFSAEYNTLQPNIDRLTKSISDLQTQQITTEAKVGPIMYVAKVLDKSPDDLIFWLTILIVSVFDPLAVALTVSTNIVIENYMEMKAKRNAKVDVEHIHEDKIPVTPIVPVEVSDETGIVPVSKKDEILNKIRKDISESSNIS